MEKEANKVMALQWLGDRVRMIDQRKLPLEEMYIECESAECVASAIKEMVIRGAPAIGVAAAMGIALGAKTADVDHSSDLLDEVEQIARMITDTRPTAVNLFWASERMLRVAKENSRLPVEDLKKRLEDEALAVRDEDEEANFKISQFGADLIPDGASVLTHCNAGALATAGCGTALGIIKQAYRRNQAIEVFADETRPFLQGSRLTSWELKREGIPVTLITDSMAGHFMNRRMISRVVVGADRIAANGDTANKIGTYSVSVLAHTNGIPFYVAAPMSTVDFDITNGSEITIEERPHEEVTHFGGVRVAPEGVRVANPSFDVTPHKYITAIVTELGVALPPYSKSLKEFL